MYLYLLYIITVHPILTKHFFLFMMISLSSNTSSTCAQFWFIAVIVCALVVYIVEQSAFVGCKQQSETTPLEHYFHTNCVPIQRQYHIIYEIVQHWYVYEYKTKYIRHDTHPSWCDNDDELFVVFTIINSACNVARVVYEFWMLCDIVMWY